MPLNRNLNTIFAIRPSSSVSFSAEAGAVFATMVTDPDPTLKTHMATLIDAEVANGNWPLYEQILFFGMDTEPNSLSDWLGLQDALAVNSPVHTPYSGSAHSGFAGYLFNGTTNYVNTQKAPNSMAQNDVAVGSWMFENLATTTTGMIFGGGSIFYLQQFPGGAQFIYRVNTSVSESVTTESFFANHSLYGFARTASNAEQFYKNGAVAGSHTNTSSAPSAATIVVGANTTGAFLSHRNCLYIAHKAVGFDFAASYTNWLTFLQNLGVEA